MTALTDTRAEARDIAALRAPLLRGKCLAALRRGSMTADEIATAIGETCLSIRPRITELLQAALIVDTGLRRLNLSGRSAKVWGRAS